MYFEQVKIRETLKLCRQLSSKLIVVGKLHDETCGNINKRSNFFSLCIQYSQTDINSIA